jgi:hypothetical protein
MGFDESDAAWALAVDELYRKIKTTVLPAILCT